MLQTHIFITGHSSIDFESLKKQLVENFNYYNSQLKPFHFEEVLERNYDSKSDFKQDVLSLFKHYQKPTILFLGNLDLLDESVQEGMLKLLEEPPENLFPVLFASGENDLLSTIKSRAQLHTLSKEIIFSLLSQDDLTVVKKYFPPAQELVKSILQQHTSVKTSLLEIDFKKIERPIIDFWLWQLQVYAEEYLNQNLEQIQLIEKTSELIEKILTARKYNSSSVQKKFSVLSIL
jgi:DNA polymerase III subunit gamma/tau